MQMRKMRFHFGSSIHLHIMSHDVYDTVHSPESHQTKRLLDAKEKSLPLKWFPGIFIISLASFSQVECSILHIYTCCYVCDFEGYTNRYTTELPAGKTCYRVPVIWQIFNGHGFDMIMESHNKMQDG